MKNAGNDEVIVPVKERMSLMEKLGVSRAMLTRTYVLYTRFKISAILGLISLVIGLATFFFINLVITPKDQFFTAYGGNYFTYVLIGMIFFNFAGISISIYLSIIKTNYFSNWLEMILSSPMRFSTYFSIVIGIAYLSAMISMVTLLGAGVFLFNAPISFNLDYPLLFLVLFLSMLAISGIGLLSASMFLLFDVKGDLEPFSWFFATFASLLAGSMFPTEVLKTLAPPLDGLWFVSRMLPHTWALEAFRVVMAGGTLDTIVGGRYIVWDCILMLIIFILIFFPAGAVGFRKGMKKAEKEGKLARWGA